MWETRLNNPKNKIIVTGCAAQINPKKYDAINDVDIVLGNKEKLTSNVWKNLNFQKPIQVNDILLEKKTVPTTIEKFDGKYVRPLNDMEIGQIAGRAGRFTKSGYFGSTLGAKFTNLKSIENIQANKFEPVKKIFWRNISKDST